MIERDCDLWEIFCTVWRVFCNVICVCWDKTVLLFWGILSFIFLVTGKEDDMIICLLSLMVIDYVSGIIKSIILKKLNSKIGYCGILKKVFTLCIIVVAYRLDIVLHLTNVTYNVRFATIGFYIANEGLSIIENATVAGLPVPTQLKDVLQQYREHKIEKEKK